MKTALLAILGTTLATSALAATTFTEGDIAIVSYNSLNPDVLGFMTVSGMEAGTSFIYTDYGWSSINNTFRFGGEGYIKCTATRDFIPGEVFVITSDALGVVGDGFTFEYDPTTVGGTIPQFAPSAAGDGTIVFQGTIDDAAPSWTGQLLFAVNADGTAPTPLGWQADATSSNTSALPTGLENDFSAIGFVRPGSLEPGWPIEYDNYNYIGPRSGTKAELLAAITSRANWTGNNDTIFTIDTTPFTVSGNSNVNVTGTLVLGDTTSSFAFPRAISYALKQGTTTLASGTWTASASSTPFSITVPSSATGAVVLELDGSSFLVRKANSTLTGSAVSIGSVVLQNGDVDASGEVDAADIDAVIAAFGSTTDQSEDVDVSGEVDAADIDIVIANFGGTDQ